MMKGAAGRGGAGREGRDALGLWDGKQEGGRASAHAKDRLVILDLRGRDFQARDPWEIFAQLAAGERMRHAARESPDNKA
jgi:hypothetical protein